MNPTCSHMRNDNEHSKKVGLDQFRPSQMLFLAFGIRDLIPFQMVETGEKGAEGKKRNGETVQTAE
ncbi:hypothetical protein M8C21_026122, partial [Ambrosia artemisiifolia]